MARSLSNAYVFFFVLTDTLSMASQRRGFAAASQGVAGLARGSGKIGKSTQEEIGRSAENSWIPDPVTGYYRPANRAAEIDVAELREMLLKRKIRSQ
ncbi:late embryogenis abundant protein 41-like [Amaranthus tricolor]|uniref:late embryogenis abundant protein 41-like n=1 Tax=Amaranthus tricolor TaxID=29722 RepID=UPI002582BCFA|nr:late embryogenis abundant protein 41-like [Amaranthus tricolor]